jgi:hypothetical protein
MAITSPVVAVIAACVLASGRPSRDGHVRTMSGRSGQLFGIQQSSERTLAPIVMLDFAYLAGLVRHGAWQLLLHWYSVSPCGTCLGCVSAYDLGHCWLRSWMCHLWLTLLGQHALVFVACSGGGRARRGGLALARNRWSEATLATLLTSDTVGFDLGCPWSRLFGWLPCTVFFASCTSL